jgi:hypothetical protein
MHMNSPIQTPLPVQHGRFHPAEADASAAMPDPSQLGLADFEALIQHHPHHRKRAGRTAPRRLLKAMKAQMAEHDAAGEAAEIGAALGAAAADLLEALSEGGDGSREERLALQYDPLQQHTLLQEARAQLERRPAGPERDRAGARLDAMQAALEARHGADLETGGAVAAAFQATLDDLSAAPLELRRLYGAQGTDRLDGPLAPAALLEALLRRAGGADLGASLAAVRGKLAAQLRARSRNGPRLWLSMADAGSFNLVQTAFSLAAELRRDVSEQAGSVPRQDAAGIAMQLLKLGEPENEQAERLMQGASDARPMTARQRGRTCRLLHEMLRRCPDGFWTGDAAARRGPLLAQLRRMVVENDAALAPLAPDPGAALETRLRSRQAASRSTPCSN